MRVSVHRFAAAAAGGALVFALAGVAFGYAGQVPATIVVSAPPGDQPCGTPLKVSVQLQDLNGVLVTDSPVEFTFVSGNGTGDIINPTRSMTDAKGIATTYVTLHCSPPHSVVVKAQSGSVSGTVVIQTNGKALPRTDVANTSQYPSMALAAFAVLLGAGMMLRRLAMARR